MKALVIEDNVKMAEGLRQGLKENGIAAEICQGGVDGEEMAAAQAYDVVILDLMLPDRDGMEVCRNLRRRKVSTPIIILTSLSTVEDKVQGLDAGADDYLSKPFTFEELLARVRSVTRRGQSTQGKVLRCDDLELDLYTRKATRGEDSWQLSSREFSLLEYLMRNQDTVLTRTQIGDKVWELSFEPTSNVIEVYISTLRKKIDKPGKRALIHTVKNAGYRFGVMG